MYCIHWSLRTEKPQVRPLAKPPENHDARQRPPQPPMSGGKLRDQPIHDRPLLSQTIDLIANTRVRGLLQRPDSHGCRSSAIRVHSVTFIAKCSPTHVLCIRRAPGAVRSTPPEAASSAGAARAPPVAVRPG